MNRRLVALALTTSLTVPAAALSPVAGPASAADAPAVVLAPVLDRITPAANGWHPTRVTAVFRGTEPGPVECRVDASAWAPCAGGVLTTPVLSGGAHTIRARMAYPEIAAGPELVVPVKVDAARPTASPAAAVRFTKSRTVTARWTAKDTQSGVGRYQVAVKRLPLGNRNASWTYPASLAALTARSVALVANRGESLCWIVRARDNAGNWGAWSSRRCTATLVDERGVARSKGWVKKKAKGTFLGTFMQTKRNGAYFALPRTNASEIAVVVTTCPVCGTVDYYVNGKLIDVIDTYSRKTKRGVVKTFRTKSKGRSVNVKVAAGTFGFVPVKIEGFGLYRS